jgi:chaperone BCS1
MSEVIAKSEKSENGFVKVYTWNPRRYYWQPRSKFFCRSLSSVVLPRATTTTILNDITHFLSEKARIFYQNHGIPYRRSYLLYGAPGAGKTSLIQAIAGHFKRSISYLQPTHPELTDDSLSSAMDGLPEETVVVLEDIDALFSKDRVNKVSQSNITFSGLLNALDGIGSSSGQLIFLTTNLRDQLDPALIRNGRVDFHVKFDDASDEQIEEMWCSYYPEKSELAGKFRERLREALGSKTIVTAGLQHFFVLHMNSTAEEALEHVDVIIEDMRQKDVQEQEQQTPDDDGDDNAEKTLPSKAHKLDVKRGVKGVKKAQQLAGKHIHIHIDSNDNKISSEALEE